MQLDAVTIKDLDIFSGEGNASVYQYLNLTTTNQGADALYQFLQKPFTSIAAIQQQQQLLQAIHQALPAWPTAITNGTVMVIEKYFETYFENYAPHPSALAVAWYKLVHKGDFSLIQYSVDHCWQFVNGLHTLALVLHTEPTQSKAYQWSQQVLAITQNPHMEAFLQATPAQRKSGYWILHYGHIIKNNWRNKLQQCIQHFAYIDAMGALAKAQVKYSLALPIFLDEPLPFIRAENLQHFLLPNAVGCSVELSPQKNFLFLTGANMAGKSTFIKSLGIAVYLAHIGLGVPAKNFQLTLFEGLLSNIHVADDLQRGESYFFNEVQRIKKIVSRVQNQHKWLILIDEIFKGTNVQDAMKCSTSVIEGLQKKSSSLFVTSSHLYEIASFVQQFSNIQCKYFETFVNNDQFSFSYQLKDGVSNDRIGYSILKREGVVALLNEL